MNRNASPTLDPAMTLSADKLRELGFDLDPPPYLTDEQAAPFLILDEPAQPRRRLWQATRAALYVIGLGAIVVGLEEYLRLVLS